MPGSTRAGLSPWELSASSTPADSVLTDEGSVTVVLETEVIDGSGAAVVLLPSSAVATGFGPWRKFRDQAFATGEFRLDKIGENWAKQKESDARRVREKQEEQDNRDHLRAVMRGSGGR